MIKIGENILESSDTSFMNFDTYVFDEDHIAKIRSELSITVIEKKTPQNYRSKKVILRNLMDTLLKVTFFYDASRCSESNYSIWNYGRPISVHYRHDLYETFSLIVTSLLPCPFMTSLLLCPFVTSLPR